MAAVAYYRDGVPYDSGNRPIITIGPNGNSNGDSNFPAGWRPSQGGSFDPNDDRMKHQWDGDFNSEDEVTKEEQAIADAMIAAQKKAFYEEKSKTEAVLAKNKKDEQSAKDNLTKANSILENEKKQLSNTKDRLEKYASEYKINQLNIEQKQEDIHYNISIAKRLGTESHYYGVIAFDGYSHKGISADETRRRLKISEEKNAESKKYFDKASVLQGQLNTLQVQKNNKDIDSTVRAVSDIINNYGEGISEIVSDKLGNQAKELANNIKGKRIRSYSDALATFNKIKQNPHLNINAKDKEAISKALKALNVKSLSNNFNLMAKTFGLIDKGFKAETLIEKAKDGFETGNYEPLLVEVEAIALSGIAATYSYSFVTAVLSGIGIAALSSPAALMIVFILTAFMAFYIDADAVRKFNDIIIPASFK